VNEIISDRKIFFYSFLGALAWTAHFLLIYAVAEFGCLADFKWIGTSISGLTVLFSLMGLWGLWKTIQYRKMLRKEERPLAWYLAYMGIANNGVFTFIIIFQSIPYFYLRECL
jgi:hypothetical protein